MVKPDQRICLGIETGDVGTFALIASHARKCQIVRNHPPAMLLGDDMIDFELNAIACLWQVTVLATIFGSCPDFSV